MFIPTNITRHIFPLYQCIGECVLSMAHFFLNPQFKCMLSSRLCKSNQPLFLSAGADFYEYFYFFPFSSFFLHRTRHILHVQMMMITSIFLFICGIRALPRIFGFACVQTAYQPCCKPYTYTYICIYVNIINLCVRSTGKIKLGYFVSLYLPLSRSCSSSGAAHIL